MPYKNPEKAREYHRDYQRMRRTGLTPGQTSNLEGPARIQTAQDVLALLEETINEVREVDADPLVKARCIGYLAGVTLRAVETADLSARVDALEEQLKSRDDRRIA
jgi:hypothetical protein